MQSEDQFLSKIQEASKSAKTTPKPEFPELRCAEHKYPIMLVCTKQDCQYSKIFLCSKCVSNQLAHLKDHDPLMVYEDFVRYIHEPSGLNFNPTEEARKLVEQKNSNIGHFNNHINEQKFQISDANKQLSQLYQDKCKELIQSLCTILEDEKDVFQKNYGKFDNEFKSDNEKDAEIPKISEIKERIATATNFQEIEDYMKLILRKKQAWKNASQDFKLLGKRTEDFYRSMVESHFENKPTFNKDNTIFDLWNQGLTNLIQQIKQQQGIYSGLFRFDEGINVEIKNLNELQLLTNQMIKAETELNINFQKIKANKEFCSDTSIALSKLTNLTHLTLNFETSTVDVEGLIQIIISIENLKSLKYFSLNTNGIVLKDNMCNAVAQVLLSLVELRQLQLHFTQNDVSCEGVQHLCSSLSGLKFLQSLNLDFRYNKIKTDGAQAIGDALSNLTSLTNLSINLGGYSVQKNIIKDQGGIFIARSISKLEQLTSISIDFGQTGIQDATLIELSISFKSLQKLQSVDIQVYSNDLTGKGPKRLTKQMMALPQIHTVVLNLNNNQIKKEGAKDVVTNFRLMKNLVSLDINLKNIGLKKEDAIELQNDLSTGKEGSQLNKKLEIHI